MLELACIGYCSIMQTHSFMLKISSHTNERLVSTDALCVPAALAFFCAVCLSSCVVLCCVACVFSPHHLCVCCCVRISPSESLLYLEAKHYQSLQLAACDSILTDLQRSKQSPLFLSRSFFCLHPTPLLFLSPPSPSSLFSPLGYFYLFFFSLSSRSYFHLRTSNPSLFLFSPFFLCLLLSLNTFNCPFLFSVFCTVLIFSFHLHDFLTQVATFLFFHPVSLPVCPPSSVRFEMLGCSCTSPNSISAAAPLVFFSLLNSGSLSLFPHIFIIQSVAIRCTCSRTRQLHHLKQIHFETNIKQRSL